MDFSGQTDLKNFTQVFQDTFQRKPSMQELKKVMKAYLKHLPSEVRRSVKRGSYRVVPGVKELVAALSKIPGVRLGLGTGNLEEGALIKLRPSGLHKYFRFGGFGIDGYESVDALNVCFNDIHADTAAGNVGSCIGGRGAWGKYQVYGFCVSKPLCRL